MVPEEVEGLVFDIQKFCVHDGPGIRTLVLLKGCPLRCLWCCNPESQSKKPQVVFFEGKCIRKAGYDCGDCLTACPRKAVYLTINGKVAVRRELCDACGLCASSCPASALTVVGQWMTVQEVFQRVWQDWVFYRRSGGGVTLSGGEPTSQPGFSIALLGRCQQAGIHTAMETCGYVPTEVLETVLPYLDLVLYDIKHMDSLAHQRMVGVPNDLVLENARQIVRSGVEMVIRVPIVPDYNDSEANIRSTAEFAASIGIGKANLLPYHGLGVMKYGRLDLEYTLQHLIRPEMEYMHVLKSIFESCGIVTKIGG